MRIETFYFVCKCLCALFTFELSASQHRFSAILKLFDLKGALDFSHVFLRFVLLCTSLPSKRALPLCLVPDHPLWGHFQCLLISNFDHHLYFSGSLHPLELSFFFLSYHRHEKWSVTLGVPFSLIVFFFFNFCYVLVKSFALIIWDSNPIPRRKVQMVLEKMYF